NGTFAIGLDGTFSGDTTFSSKEGANPPQLVVTYTPPPTYTIYHGNTHAHSSYSWDSAANNQDPAGLYALGVANNYQYFTVTDHNKSPVFLPVSPTNAAWLDSKSAGYNATTNGSFVGVAGFEHSENNEGSPNPNPGVGHFTVLNTSTYISP